MIENDILKVTPTTPYQQEQIQKMPDWFKSSAGWWGEGLLTDQHFVNGIQWLIKNGIIIIQQ